MSGGAETFVTPLYLDFEWYVTLLLYLGWPKELIESFLIDYNVEDNKLHTTFCQNGLVDPIHTSSRN